MRIKSWYDEEKQKGRQLHAPHLLHDALDDLATWPPNWNSYDALPIKPEVIEYAHIWAERFLPCSMTLQDYNEFLLDPYPERAYPDGICGEPSTGGVVFWWALPEKRLSIYIDPDGMVSYVRVDGQRITEGESVQYDQYLLVWHWLFSSPS